MNVFADRRDHLRFEITGQLWASLDVSAEMTLHNISTSGALVETPSGYMWLALRTLTVRMRAEGAAVTGVVRHVSQSPDAPYRQLVGLQFVNVSPAALAELEQLVGEWSR